MNMDTDTHAEGKGTSGADVAQVQPQTNTALLPPSGMARWVKYFGCFYAVVIALIGVLPSLDGPNTPVRPVVVTVVVAVGFALCSFRASSIFSRLHSRLAGADAASLPSGPADGDVDLLLYRRVQSFTFLFAVPGIVLGIIGLVAGLLDRIGVHGNSDLPWIVVAGIAGLGVLLLVSIAAGTIGICVAALLTLIPAALGSGHSRSALVRPHSRAGALLDLASLIIVSPILSMGLWLGLLITLVAQQKPRRP
jgi:hypothetical protein